jgi:hypothetical protein
MELKIYSKEGNLKLTASPDSNSAATCGIQEESVLSLSFTAFECVTLEVYDYADFLGRRYWILERYQPKMNCDSEWSYSVQLSGVEGLTTQVLMVNPDDDDNPILTLTAPAREHAALIIANMNRKMGTTEWKVGEVVVSEYIDIEYTGKYASDALSELSSAAGTEWWFDGMTLNISRCEFGEPVPLSYGDGLIGGIERSMADGVKFFTRLFPVGSSRNIDPDRYGHARLQLPDGAKYVEQDTHLGIIEYFEQEAFDAIYPRRIGTVGAVRSEERTSDDGSPFTVWYFTDPDIPFDPNQYEIGGLVKRVTFQTGELRGREFEVNYDSEKKEFEIITQWPYDNDMQLPSEPLVPAPGNEYVLWNISMPDSYYPAAEQEFKTAVDTFMADSRKDISVFQASTDFTVVDKRNLDLKPGQRIRLGSDKFFPDTGYRDIRIVAISRSVVQPGSMTLKMSDVLSTGRISRIENQISEVTQITRQVSSEFPDIIKSWEETPASDTTLYSSRKSEREFLNKRRGGTVEGITRFLKRQQLDEGFRTSDFASGITGFGAQIDGRGAGELESLFIRRFLEVPELRKNRVGISVGDDWSAPGAGVIESVDKDQKLVTLKLEEGEIGAVAVEDICMGIFHDFDPSNNATADSDDGRGNFSFAGFATVYFRITEVLGDRNEQFRYELRPLSATFTRQIDPMESMTFVAYGSFTNPARQSSRYSTRTYQRYLRNVSDWEFTAENIAAQFGDLTNLSVFGIQMSGYSAYLDNIYLQGMISSLDKKALLDTRSKLFRLVGDNGVGVAFTPEAGWKQGKLYDPATGQFQKEFDIEQIDQTATEAQATANSADRKAQQAKDYIDNTLPGELSEINKRLDGVVENWFYPYTPSLYNEPAQTWIADGEQENHIGDTFTNTLPANFDPTDAGCWEQGSIVAPYIDGIKTWDQIKIADSTRIRLKTPVGGIPKGAVLSVGEGYTMGYNPIASSGAVIASYVWSQSYTVGSDNPYIAFVIRKTDNAKITPAEYPQIHFTISSDETTNPDAGKSWRWVKEEDGTYKWTPIADSDAVKALQEAARAQDTADAKRRVFVVTPTTPYDVGDIWTQGEGGDIMRCIESRATGNFESSDWDKASKYTDDTAANEAKDEIANLQFGARNYIAKQFIREWNSVKEGVTDVVTSGADADGAYLYVNWSKLIQAGLAATNASQVSTVPDCFGGQIKYKPNTPYVFKARIKQGAEITFRIVYEDGTKEVLSAPPAGTEGVYEVVHTIDASRVVQKIYMYVGKGVSMYLYDIQLTEGNKAPTGYITAEEDVQAQIEQVKLDVDYIASDSSLTPSDKQQVANEWVRIQNEYWSIMANAEKYDVPTDSFTVYFQALEDYLTPLLADMSTTSEITGTEFRKVFSDYYEISSNMSDLIDDAIDESIKSTEYLKKAMEDGSTEVKGGLIMTNVMLLKNAEGDVTAGVSGLQEDDVPFWSGADYTNRKKAVFRVHADGEVHATKGTVGILQVKNDSVEVSDATASGNKIILTTNNINSVSQVLGSSEVPSSQTTESIAVITSQTKPFASDSRNSSQFKCGAEVQMSAQVKGTIRGGGSVKIEIINRTADTTDTIFRQSSAYDDTGSIQINKNIRYRFTTPAYYYIKVTVEASYPGGLGNAASAAVEAITFSFVTDIRKNLIAPNGVAVVKGSSNYAVFTGDIFEVLIGKAGLRIQNGYVYKRDTDHTTWTKI